MLHLPRVLIIDDEQDLLRTLAIVLKPDFLISTASSPITALQNLPGSPVDVVLCDISMPELSGIEVLKRIKQIDPAIEVIMLTALNDTSLAVQAAREGAYDFVIKPADMETLKLHISRAFEKKSLLSENLQLKKELDHVKWQSFAGMIGASASIKAVFDLIKKISSSDVSVMIQGETGTGKEMIAHAIHQQSSRQNAPFIPVNCGAIPRELFESEIFGYEKGAFTGAHSSRPGKFEAASGGTLFLDEITALSLDMQVKLLRLIQDQEVYRVGATSPIQIDVRIISAANEDLRTKIAQGQFREDLYHRLAIVPLQVPALRERHEDIPLLVWYFLDRFNHKYNKLFTHIEPSALTVMQGYSWSGNVRELEHLIERIVALEEGPSFKEAYLPLEFYIKTVSLETGSTYKGLLKDFDRQILSAALIKTGYNQLKAANLLGLSRSTFVSKLSVLGIKPSPTEIPE